MGWESIASLAGSAGGILDTVIGTNINRSDASKYRNWVEDLRRTEHQVEVEDLIAAGLNPILSANSGASATGQLWQTGQSDIDFNQGKAIAETNAAIQNIKESKSRELLNSVTTAKVEEDKKVSAANAVQSGIDAQIKQQMFDNIYNTKAGVSIMPALQASGFAPLKAAGGAVVSAVEGAKGVGSGVANAARVSADWIKDMYKSFMNPASSAKQLRKEKESSIEQDEKTKKWSMPDDYFGSKRPADPSDFEGIY